MIKTIMTGSTFFSTIFGFLSSVCWTIYGIYKADINLIVTNGLGLFFIIFQVIVYIIIKYIYSFYLLPFFSFLSLLFKLNILINLFKIPFPFFEELS